MVITVRLTGDQHAALKALAAAEHRSLSQQVRHLVDAHLAASAESASA